MFEGTFCKIMLWNILYYTLMRNIRLIIKLEQTHFLLSEIVCILKFVPRIFVNIFLLLFISFQVHLTKIPFLEHEKKTSKYIEGEKIKNMINSGILGVSTS